MWTRKQLPGVNTVNRPINVCYVRAVFNKLTYLLARLATTTLHSCLMMMRLTPLTLSHRYMTPWNQICQHAPRWPQEMHPRRGLRQQRIRQTVQRMRRWRKKVEKTGMKSYHLIYMLTMKRPSHADTTTALCSGPRFHSAMSAVRLFDLQARYHHWQLLSMLWHCWLGARKSIRPVKIKWWGVGMVMCLKLGADCLHMVQLMPLTPLSLAWF